MAADRLAEGVSGEQPPAGAPSWCRSRVVAPPVVRGCGGGDGHPRSRLRLRLTGGEVDAVGFERLLAEARAREALALWHGDPLADLADEPFAAAEMRRLDGLRVRAAEAAIDADLAAAAGRRDRRAGGADRRASAAPAAARPRMLALCRTGRQAEALERNRERAHGARRPDRRRAGRRAAPSPGGDPGPGPGARPRARAAAGTAGGRSASACGTASRPCSRSPRCCCSRAPSRSASVA